LESRNLRDITPRYPELAGLGTRLRGQDVVLDGEVVAFTPEGKPSFGLLQQRMHLASEPEVRRRMSTVRTAYLVFGVLSPAGRAADGLLRGRSAAVRREGRHRVHGGRARPPRC